MTFSPNSAKIAFLALMATASLQLNGCVVGTAVGVAGETVETAVEITGTTAATTAKVTGAVIGGTVDAVIPGDQSGRDKDED
ncbi:MAG: hypothetical protein ACWA5L_06670 [bacterium]